MFARTMNYGLYLNFCLGVIEIFLPLSIWLTCLILNLFVTVVIN